jgi:hypothetical protein
VATQITASTPRSGPVPRLGFVGTAIVAAIAVAMIGIGAWSQAGSILDDKGETQAYGAGYPLHGGLAGPSRFVPGFDLDGHYAAGYPLHGGLAGPSRSLPVFDLDGHHGAGYPLNGGLAGPSRADGGE